MPVFSHHLFRFPLLAGLPDVLLANLASQMSERQFSRREMVVSKDQPVHALGFLVDGRLQGVDFTVDGRGVGLYFVDPGDFFAELSVVDGRPPAEHLIAAAKSTVLFLDGDMARSLIFDHADVAQRVMTRLASRVREVMAQRTLLGLPNPSQRLCVQLLQLARQNGRGDLVADPAPTHQELAIMINSSRETVTRAFQALTLKEAIRRDGSALIVTRPEFLHDVGLGKLELGRS